MFTFNSRYAIPMAVMLIWLAPVRATDLDPKALTYKLLSPRPAGPDELALLFAESLNAA
jgi:hypothetical protein